MPTRKQAVTDGITSEDRTLITAPLDERDFDAYVRDHNREWDRHGTFDGRVAHLERLCRARFDAWSATQVPGRSIALDFGSREWYAREILVLIQEVREALKSQGFEALTGGPEEFAGFIVTETEKWNEAAKAAGLKK